MSGSSKANGITIRGPYEILARIGAGGMGEVYCARDPRLNREVAIKVRGHGLVLGFETGGGSLAKRSGSMPTRLRGRGESRRSARLQD